MLAFLPLLDASTLTLFHKRTQLSLAMSPTVARRMDCAQVLTNVRRVGAPTRGRRSLEHNNLDDAAKEQHQSAAGERVELFL